MIRVFEAADTEVWATFRSRLWPHASPQGLALESRRFARGQPVANITAVFLAQDEAAIPVGFLELSVRAFADGCESMLVPHIEGWYVEPAARGKGFGAALMQAAEGWARSNGFVEIASDTEAGNQRSRGAHAACGFTEVEYAIKLRKSLAVPQ
ncbi:MAG: GNAT family N-acetyltransferase [Candidatus Acidiferrales bacterium]